MNVFGNLFKKKKRESMSSKTLQERGFNEEILLLIKGVAGTVLYPLQNYHEVTIGPSSK